VSSKRAAPLLVCYGQLLTNQIFGWDRIQSDQIQSEIKYGSWLPQSLDSLKASKKIRGNLPTIWKESKQIKKINRPAISSFAGADLSLAARLLSKFKQIRFNLFPYLQGDDYTLALLINSPPGVQGKRTSTDGPRTRRERTPQAEASSQRTVRSRIQRLLKNYFSIQGVDTLITPSSQGISGTRREGIPNWRRF